MEHNLHAVGVPNYSKFSAFNNDARYFCEPCNTPYSAKGCGDPTAHFCAGICYGCYQFHCNDATGDKANGKYCEQCNRYFGTIEWFTAHQSRQPMPVSAGADDISDRHSYVVCDMVKMCEKCGHCINRFRSNNDKHICNTYFCKQCKFRHSGTEGCYIRPYKPKHEGKLHTNKVLFIDFKTCYTEDVRSTGTVHTQLPCYVACGMLFKPDRLWEIKKLLEVSAISPVESSVT